MAKSLYALPVGSVVKSANTKYNGQAIRWIVGTQDTSQGRTGLVTEKMITLKCFDAKEPSNCHPYSSWERGTNENTNGLIRRWFPKGTDFSKVSVQEIQKVEDWLNAYPREILGFLSADAVFSTAFAACV